MKAVHFGAGNIGRGFIGLLLSQSGYRVTFVDVNDDVVRALQERGRYTVRFASASGQAETVTGVSAIHGGQREDVANAVATADLVTTAIGVSALRHIASNVAEGIRRRLSGSRRPLMVIACENAIGGSSQLEQLVHAELSEDERRAASGLIAFPNAAVDRIVPIQRHEDPLTVTVEPFSEWVVERPAAEAAGLREQAAAMAGVHCVDDLEPYISRKLFTVNTGHATAAYHGYLRGCATIQEAMADEALHAEVYRTLQETGEVLIRRYGFDAAGHAAYIRTILERFANPFLTDEVTRVGRSPIRKLSRGDRFVRPALLAYELGLGAEGLVNAIAAALRFRPQDDAEAAELQAALRERGIGEVITAYMGISPDHPLHAAIAARYAEQGEEMGA